MKMLSLILIVTATTFFGTPNATKSVTVSINKNLELFGLMMQLDMGPDLAASIEFRNYRE